MSERSQNVVVWRTAPATLSDSISRAHRMPSPTLIRRNRMTWVPTYAPLMGRLRRPGQRRQAWFDGLTKGFEPVLEQRQGTELVTADERRPITRHVYGG
jgi:hypothetical protein